VSLDGARLRRLDVDSVNSRSDYVSCRSISSAVTHCRKQLQKWTLLAGSRSCKAWITVILYDLSCSSCVALLHSTVTLQSLWSRHWALGTYSLVFCLLRVSLIEVHSNCELFVCWELFHPKFLLPLYSRIVFDISVLQKYLLLWSIPHHDRTQCLIIVTEQMANGVDNCRPLLKNHKHIPTHEPH
jgi:hypothetical protein